MSLTVILIRHAKSDWADAGLSDHDRPLNERGRQAAPRIGAWLKAQGFAPDTCLCSSARRTQETWEGIASQLTAPPEPVLSRGLYHASPVDMLAAIRGMDGPAIALIGHNPGIGSLARTLATIAPEHPKFGLYPTGAVTVLGFDVTDPVEITPGQGKVLGFVVPRDLPDPQ